MAVRYNSFDNNAVVPKLPTQSYTPQITNTNADTDPSTYYTKVMGFLPVDTRYLSNPTNGLSYNSYADVLLNTEAWSKRWDKSEYSWLNTPLGYLPRVIVDSVLLLKNQNIDPIVNSIKDYGFGKGLGIGASTATLNALTNIGNSLDILSNPIKGLVLDGPDGFVKGLIGDHIGRKQYDYADYIELGDGFWNNAGEMLLSGVAEMFSDPMTYVSFGISNLGKLGGKATGKTLGDIVTETADTLTKAGAKAVVKESVTDNVVKSTTKYVLANGDDAIDIVKSIASKYGSTIDDTTAEGLLKNIVDANGVNETLISKAHSAADQMGEMITKAAISDNPKALKELPNNLRSKGALVRAAYTVDDNNFLTPGLQNYYASMLNDTTLKPTLRYAKNIQNFQNTFFNILKTPIESTSAIGLLKLGKKGGGALINKFKAMKQIAKIQDAVINNEKFLDITKTKINFDGNVVDIPVNKLSNNQYTEPTKVVNVNNTDDILKLSEHSTNTGLVIVEQISSDAHETINGFIDDILTEFQNELYASEYLTQAEYTALRDLYIKRLDNRIQSFGFGKIYPFHDFDSYKRYVRSLNTPNNPTWVRQLNDKFDTLEAYFNKEVNPAFLQELQVSLNAHAAKTVQNVLASMKDANQNTNLDEFTRALNHLNKSSNNTASNKISKESRELAMSLLTDANEVLDEYIFSLSYYMDDIMSLSKNIKRYAGSETEHGEFNNYILDEEYDTLIESIGNYNAVLSEMNELMLAYGYKSEYAHNNIQQFLVDNREFTSCKIKQADGTYKSYSAYDAHKLYNKFITQTTRTLQSYETLRKALNQDVNKLYEHAITKGKDLLTDIDRYKIAVDKLPILNEDIFSYYTDTANVKDIINYGLIGYGTMVSKRRLINDLLSGYGTENATGFAKLLTEYNRNSSAVKQLLTKQLGNDETVITLVNTLDNINGYMKCVKELNTLLSPVSDLHKQGMIDSFISKLGEFNAFDDSHIEETIDTIINAGDLLVNSRFNVPKLSMDFQLWKIAKENADKSGITIQDRSRAKALLNRLKSDTSHNAEVDVLNLVDMIHFTPELHNGLVKAAAGKQVLVFDIETTGTKNARMFQLSARVLDAQGNDTGKYRTYSIKVPADMLPDQIVMEKLSPGYLGEEAKSWFIKEYVEGTGDTILFNSRYEALNQFAKDFSIMDGADYLLCGHNIESFDLTQLIQNAWSGKNYKAKTFFNNTLKNHNYFDTYNILQNQYMWKVDKLTREIVSTKLRRFIQNSKFLQDGSPRHKLINYGTLLQLNHVKQLLQDGVASTTPVLKTKPKFKLIHNSKINNGDIITLSEPMSETAETFLKNAKIDYTLEEVVNNDKVTYLYRFKDKQFTDSEASALYSFMTQAENDIAINKLMGATYEANVTEFDSQSGDLLQEYIDNAINNLRDVWNMHTGKAADRYVTAANVFDPDVLQKLIEKDIINLPFGLSQFIDEKSKASVGHNIMQIFNRYILDEDRVVLQPYKLYHYEFANSFDPNKIIEYYKEHSVKYGLLGTNEAPVSTLHSLTKASQSITKIRNGLTVAATEEAHSAAKAFLTMYTTLDPNGKYAPFIYDFTDGSNKKLTVATAMYLANNDKRFISDNRELYDALTFETVYSLDDDVKRIYKATDADWIAYLKERNAKWNEAFDKRIARNASYAKRSEFWDQLKQERKDAAKIKQKLRDKKERALAQAKEDSRITAIHNAEEASKRIWSGELGTDEDFQAALKANANDPLLAFRNIYDDEHLLSTTKQVKSTVYAETHRYVKAYSDLLNSKTPEDQTKIIEQLRNYDKANTELNLKRILNRDNRVEALKAEARYTGGRVVFATDKPVNISDFEKDNDLITLIIPYEIDITQPSNPIFNTVVEGNGFNIVKNKPKTKTVYLNFIGVKQSAYQDVIVVDKPLSKHSLALLDKNNIKYTVQEVEIDGVIKYKYYYNGASELNALPAANIISSDMDTDLKKLLTDANKQFSGAVTNPGFSNGDVITKDLLYAIDDMLPEGIKKQLVPIHVLESNGFFNVLRGNNAVIGSTEVQRIFNKHYSSNRFNRIAYTVKQNIDTQVDNLSLFINFLCNKENGIKTQEAFNSLTNAEIRALQKEHPDWKLLWVSTSSPNAKVTTKSGYQVHVITDFSDKSLDAARKINAHFVPADLAYTLQQSINNFELTGSLRFIQQLSQGYKLGYLGSIGMVIRNFIDSNHKNRMDLYHTFKLPKQISRLKSSFQILNKYQDTVLSYVNNTGKMLTDLTEYKALYYLSTSTPEFLNEIIQSNTNLAKAIVRLQEYYTPESLAKIKDKLLDIELFEFTNNFINNAPSAGLYRKIIDELNSSNTDKSVLRWVTKSTPLALLFDSNEMVEQCVRFSRYIEDLQANHSLSEAALNLIHTHFDYADKSLAMIYTELVFPFMSFSFKNLNYWLETFSKNAPAIFELENIFRTILNYHSLFNPDQEAYEAYDYTFDFGKELQFQSKIPWQLINAAKLYQALAGNIVISTDKTVERDRGYGEQLLELSNVFKLSPSFLDATKLLFNPLNTYQERMLPPYEALANLVPDILNGKQSTDAISISEVANLVPFIGANTQRWGVGNTNNMPQRIKDLGIHQLMASVFSATYVPKKDYNSWYNNNFETIGGFKQNYSSKRAYDNPYNFKIPNYINYCRAKSTNRTKDLYSTSKLNTLYKYRYNSLINNKAAYILRYRVKDDYHY